MTLHSTPLGHQMPLCQTYAEEWYYIDLWSIGGGGLVCVHCAIYETYAV